MGRLVEPACKGSIFHRDNIEDEKRLDGSPPSTCCIVIKGVNICKRAKTKPLFSFSSSVYDIVFLAKKFFFLKLTG